MICKNCGRPLNNKICDYCGTDYRTDEEKEKVECNHLFESVMYEEYPKDMTGKLLFRCRYCNQVKTIPITGKLLRFLTMR